jgi:hypothetical protein
LYVPFPAGIACYDGLLTIYRRHLASYAHQDEGRRYKRCRCPIWVQGSLGGEKIRRVSLARIASVTLAGFNAGGPLLMLPVGGPLQGEVREGTL